MSGKKFGRPPSTSREEILETALEILKEGEDAFSMRNLANRLGTAPTSVYNYFTNKEALLDALAEMALSDLWVDCQAEGEWREQLRRWMHAFHEALIAAPELMHLIGLACASPRFLAQVKQLNDLIARSGLDEHSCALQAQSLLWTVIGFAFQQTNAATPKMKRRMKATSRKSPHPEMTQHLAIADFGELWSITVVREIAGLTAIAEGKAPD